MHVGCRSDLGEYDGKRMYDLTNVSVLLVRFQYALIRFMQGADVCSVGADRRRSWISEHNLGRAEVVVNDTSYVITAVNRMLSRTSGICSSADPGVDVRCIEQDCPRHMIGLGLE